MKSVVQFIQVDLENQSLVDQVQDILTSLKKRKEDRSGVSNDTEYLVTDYEIVILEALLNLGKVPRSSLDFILKQAGCEQSSNYCKFAWQEVVEFVQEIDFENTALLA